MVDTVVLEVRRWGELEQLGEMSDEVDAELECELQSRMRTQA
jgi:hypothetical protein